MIKKFFILFLTLNLMGCLTIQTKEKPNKECDLTTNELEFDSNGKFLSTTADIGGILSKGGEAVVPILLTILATELTYTASSSVIASSVYITGNIIHWLEKSITCDEPEIAEVEQEEVMIDT